ncbi:MAG TPA: T9SS type A sorting domain-containing protein, partial [Rubricoccaceae bacterium]
TWDAKAGAWGSGFRERLVYDAAGRPASYTFQGVDGPGEGWTDGFRELYAVDAGGRRTETVYQDSREGEWVNTFQLLYAVDADGRPSVDLDNEWDGTAWQPVRRNLYRYEGEVAGEPTAGAVRLTLVAAPNPSRGLVRVTTALDVAGEATLDVFDVRGRRVARLFAGARPAGTQTVTFDTGRLAPGVYTVRLAAGGGATSQAITVVR